MSGIEFIVENKTKLAKELRRYILKKSYLAYPRIKSAFRDYVINKVIGEWIYDTAFVKWIFSEEGLGFLGWKTSFAKNQIERMISEMKKDVIITTGNEPRGKFIEYKLSNKDYLESVLKVEVKRKRIAKRGQKREEYTFLEEWYTWLTNGERVSSDGFRVIYDVGRGVSGLASMGDSDDAAFSSGKENVAPLLRPPLVEVWATHKKDIRATVETIIENEMKRVLNEQS